MKEQCYQYTTDLLVIGCGFSGMWLPCAPGTFWATCWSWTRAPETGAAGRAFRRGHDRQATRNELDDLLDDLVYYYDGLADQKLLGQILTQSYDRFMDFENLGHKFVRNDKGELCFIPQRALDYMRYYYYHPYGWAASKKPACSSRNAKSGACGGLGARSSPTSSPTANA